VNKAINIAINLLIEVWDSHSSSLHNHVTLLMSKHIRLFSCGDSLAAKRRKQWWSKTYSIVYLAIKSILGKLLTTFCSSWTGLQIEIGFNAVNAICRKLTYFPNRRRVSIKCDGKVATNFESANQGCFDGNEIFCIIIFWVQLFYFLHYY